jgi:hypothetical protein
MFDFWRRQKRRSTTVLRPSRWRRRRRGILCRSLWFRSFIPRFLKLITTLRFVLAYETEKINLNLCKPLNVIILWPSPFDHFILMITHVTCFYLLFTRSQDLKIWTQKVACSFDTDHIWSGFYFTKVHAFGFFILQSCELKLFPYYLTNRPQYYQQSNSFAFRKKQFSKS